MGLGRLFFGVSDGEVAGSFELHPSSAVPAAVATPVCKKFRLFISGSLCGQHELFKDSFSAFYL